MADETDPNDKPNCLVADRFLDWSEELAEELQIQRYLIFTTAGPFPSAVLQGQVEGEQQIDGGRIQKSKVLEWLDSQTVASVVYVALGTMANVLLPLIHELASGLELSGVPFLWVLRFCSIHLLEPSYVSLWMESISSGVPLLTWHLGGDQPARFIVDGLKLGLPMRKLGNIEPVGKGEDIAATIKTLMVDEKGKEVQKNSIRFKELAMGSMRNGDFHIVIVECLTCC
ncbi:unnamed protein product [Calypogeia fissa]